MKLIFCFSSNQPYMRLARGAGWWPGARLPATIYPEHYPLSFVDQDWRKFDGLTPMQPEYQKAYVRYLQALETTRPAMASVVDWEVGRPFSEVMRWADEASGLARDTIMIIPKIAGCVDVIPETINGKQVILGISIPTPHGGTPCLPMEFAGRACHLLGGSIKQQMQWAATLTALGATIVSADGNSFHKAAGRGTYFDGTRFLNDGANVTPTIEAFQRSLTNIPKAWTRAGWVLE